MRFRVLGPIEVMGVGGARVAMVSAPQRRLAAMLVLRAGTIVPADHLAEHLQLSSGALRTAVSRLRRIVGFDVLATAPPGYELRSDDIDSRRFEHLVVTARTSDDNEAAAALFEQALALWHGAAYEEFAGEEWAMIEATRLDELRSGAIEDLAECLLVAGRHERAIERLDPLIVQQPFRDRPRGQLMRALAGCGRQAEALRAFNDYRTFLVDETGTEPSASVAALDREIALGEFAAPISAAPRVARPSGVVTFLFTDIEGSTRLWGQHPVEMNVAIERHHQIVTGVAESIGGSVFSSGGDGFAVAFADPVAAVAAAVQSQRLIEAEPWPDPVAVRVRMGIHTGTAYERGGDYFGPTLNMTARLMSAGRGRQLLVSGTTRRLVGDDAIPDGAEIRARGMHRLADIAEPVEIFEVRMSGVAPVELPLRTPMLAASALAPLRTSIIGREREVAQIESLLDDHRLVTIVGPGGCGKSAIGLTVAHRSVGVFAGGVFVVDLSSVVAADAFVSSVARALRIPLAHVDSIEALVDECADRQLLLVLDNGEHLADEVAQFTDALLDRPGSSMLVTSRAPLDVVGERVVAVGPLDGVGPGGHSDAVHLFIERAVAAGATLDLSDGGLAEIERLCARLDRLPLAIELAAASALHSSPHQLRTDIDRGSSVGVSRRSTRRWSTVEEMIDWSYQLLDPVAQSFLRSMAPFRGAASAEAIGATWSPGADSARVSDVIAELLRVNLLVAEPTDSGSQYRLLETVRAFTVDRATEGGELLGLRERHRDWYLRWTESHSALERCLSSRLALLHDAQIDNLRAAMAYSIEVGDRARASRQASALSSVWWLLGRGDEGMTWLANAGDAATTALDRAAHRLAHFGAAMGAADWHAMAAARELLPDVVTQSGGELGPLALALHAVTSFGPVDDTLATIQQAIDAATDASTLCRQILDNFAGEALMLAGRFPEAAATYRTRHPWRTSDSDPWWTCASMTSCAIASMLSGDVAGGLKLATRATELSATSELIRLQGGSSALTVLAVGAALDGDTATAADLIVEHSEQLASVTKRADRRAAPLGGAAFVLALHGETDLAATIVAHVVATGAAGAPWLHALCRRVGEMTAGSTPVGDVEDVRAAALHALGRLAGARRGE